MGCGTLLRLARGAGAASRRCPRYRGFAGFPLAYWGGLYRGLRAVNLPPRRPGWYIWGIETSIEDRGAHQKTRRLDIPAVHPDRRASRCLWFVRQLSGVLLTFLMAAILARSQPRCVVSSQLRVPRILAVVGVFVALISVVAALLVLNPAIGQAQTLIQNPRPW